MKIKLAQDEFGRSRVKMFSGGVCIASVSEADFAKSWSERELTQLKQSAG